MFLGYLLSRKTYRKRRSVFVEKKEVSGCARKSSTAMSPISILCKEEGSQSPPRENREVFSMWKGGKLLKTLSPEGKGGKTVRKLLLSLILKKLCTETSRTRRRGEGEVFSQEEKGWKPEISMGKGEKKGGLRLRREGR